MNISQRLRTCARHTGLDAVIELLNEAADEIDAMQARANGQATQPAEVTDQLIEAEFQQCGGKWNGDQWIIEDADLHPFARSIIALRPMQVPMTDEQHNDIVCTVTTLCAKLSRQAIAGMAIDWTEAHHGITAQAKKEDE